MADPANQARDLAATARIRIVRAGTAGYRVWLDTTVIGHVVRADDSWSAATAPPALYLTKHGMPKRNRAVRWLITQHLEAP